MYSKIVKYFLLFASVYFLIEAVFHFSGLRLMSTLSRWSVSAFTYGEFMSNLYASFILLAALLAFEAQRDVKKYKNMIYLTGVWAFFHGALLLYKLLNVDFVKAFDGYSSLYVWIYWYNYYLVFESLLAFLYGFFVFLWYLTNRKK